MQNAGQNPNAGTAPAQAPATPTTEETVPAATPVTKDVPAVK